MPASFDIPFGNQKADKIPTTVFAQFQYSKPALKPISVCARGCNFPLSVVRMTKRFSVAKRAKSRVAVSFLLYSRRLSSRPFENYAEDYTGQAGGLILWVFDSSCSDAWSVGCAWDETGLKIAVYASRQRADVSAPLLRCQVVVSETTWNT